MGNDLDRGFLKELLQIIKHLQLTIHHYDVFIAQLLHIKRKGSMPSTLTKILYSHFRELADSLA